MARMFVIGEDGLCCALGTKLVTDVLGGSLAQPAVDTKGVTNLKRNLARYTQIAHLYPVLCLADTDGQCALLLRRQWLGGKAPDRFHLRLAVPEVESWVMADREALANFFRLSEPLIPDRPDELPDAKQALLNLAKRSRYQPVCQEIVTRTGNPGTGYNVHLRTFVLQYWQPRRAQAHSPSLARAIRRLGELKTCPA
jgi:hypothetical protein